MSMNQPVETRGGYQPKAPQNNPANVNLLGGNGTNGDYTGFKYGENKALNESRVEGNAAVGSVKAAAPTQNLASSMLADVTPLDADTQDSLPTSDGVDVGRGRGSETLLGQQNNQDQNMAEGLYLMQRYLPELINVTRLNGTPDSYKKLVNAIKQKVIG